MMETIARTRFVARAGLLCPTSNYYDSSRSRANSDFWLSTLIALCANGWHAATGMIHANRRCMFPEREQAAIP
jgi:hypothetical protein